MNLKYFALVVSCLFINNLYSVEVGKEMQQALNTADFQTVKKLIESGKESAKNTLRGKTLLIEAIGTYQSYKYNRYWYPARAQDTPGIAERGQENIVKDAEKIFMFLLNQGAAINNTDYSKVTPLQVAMQLKMPEIVKILLQHGADTTIKNSDDLTPLQYAVKNNLPDIFELLLMHGADASAVVEDIKKRQQELAEHAKYFLANKSYSTTYNKQRLSKEEYIKRNLADMMDVFLHDGTDRSTTNKALLADAYHQEYYYRGSDFTNLVNDVKNNTRMTYIIDGYAKNKQRMGQQLPIIAKRQQDPQKSKTGLASFSFK